MVVLFFKAVYTGYRTSAPFETKLSTHSIDLGNLLFSLENYQEAISAHFGLNKEEARLRVKHAQSLLLSTLGIDTRIPI